MKSAVFGAILALLSSIALAADPQRSVIVTFPDNTPDNVVFEAKDAIKSGGGTITNEFKYIKAFSATVGSNAFQSLRVMGEQWEFKIEDDGEFGVYDCRYHDF